MINRHWPAAGAAALAFMLLGIAPSNWDPEKLCNTVSVPAVSRLKTTPPDEEEPPFKVVP
jgi:hypothetical protein